MATVMVSIISTVWVEHMRTYLEPGATYECEAADADKLVKAGAAAYMDGGADASPEPVAEPEAVAEDAPAEEETSEGEPAPASEPESESQPVEETGESEGN